MNVISEDTIFEGRPSDSPYIEMVWRGRAGREYFPVCPADVRWDLLLLRDRGQVKVSIEGPLTKARAKSQREGVEWLVIKFKLGVYMPRLRISNLLDGDVVLPAEADASFWLNGSTWQFPDYENVETFVNRLARDGVLLRDPVVNAVLQDHDSPGAMSVRTVRRHFVHATGLAPKAIQQIERAQQTAALLQQGVSILDAVHRAGYADQPHMTRSLRRFIGQTPAQIAQAKSLQ
jgi:AraC-like DNA-binding protein